MKDTFSYEETLALSKSVSDEAMSIVLDALASIIHESEARGRTVTPDGLIEMIHRVREIYEQGVDFKALFDRVAAFRRQ